MAIAPVPPRSPSRSSPGGKVEPYRRSLQGLSGATLSDLAWRKPSEIPSRTRSVSAFLPGEFSADPAPSANLAHEGMAPLHP